MTDLITSDPAICHGKPCLRGTRITVSDIQDLVANAYTRSEIMEEYPGLTVEQIDAPAKFDWRKV